MKSYFDNIKAYRLKQMLHVDPGIHKSILNSVFDELVMMVARDIFSPSDLRIELYNRLHKK